MKGNPAKQDGWVCQCGNKLHFEQNKAHCAIEHSDYLLQNNLLQKI
jgi:hypothetical protein